MNERAIRLVVREPALERSRLTVGFRLFLAIPHFIWAAGWFSLAYLIAIANWIATLATGTPPTMFHGFLSAYVRYIAHLAAYISIVANPYPKFTGGAGYPVEVEIDPPQRQNRWVTGFRIFLALPAILLADTLMGGGTSALGGSNISSGGALATVALLGWFAAVFTARMPPGLRDLGAYAIGYSAQVTGYVLLLTDRYPNSDPAVYESANVYRNDPIRLTVADDQRRSRLTVFFRFPLWIPHLLWALLWTIPVFFAWLAMWTVTLIRGVPPSALHRFLGAYTRYLVHLFAYVQLVGNPFPGFVGKPRSYPLDLEIDGPERQNRWVTAFRGILVFPAVLIASALAGAALTAAFLSWWYAMFRGRVPRGLRNLGAYELRYYAQYMGYALLLTDRYPWSGPQAGWQMTLAPATPAQT